jgi:aspartyl/asparaginyl beta-hydroxylase (cupin superfamily)
MAISSQGERVVDGSKSISSVGPSCSILDEADEAMARGDVRQAASLLEIAAQRGRDASTLFRLATVRRSLGDFPGAVTAAEAAVELAPRNFLMAMLLGSLREMTGARHAAERAYRAACAYAPLNLSFQPAIQKKLDSARRQVEMVQAWRKRLLEWQPEGGLSGLAGDENRRVRQFRSNILENLDAGPTAPPMFLFPGIQSERFFEPSDFSGVQELAQATDAVRDEFFGLIEDRLADFAGRLGGLHFADDGGRPGKWSMIPLIRNGDVFDEFASRCPTTMRLAAGLNLPKLGHISPSLYFSILEPNSRIAPHIGITNARVIAHWPLIVPDGCAFRVGGETREWQVGRPLVFDDMTTHEAWNDSDRIRVVLIADLWRPELSPLERVAVADLMDCSEAPPADQRSKSAQ